MSPGVESLVLLVHRTIGYPLAFLVAPFALVTFAGAAGHRWAGQLYLALMTFLYVSGTSLTLTRHDWGSWQFFYNVVFNFLGYSMVWYAARSMRLYRRPGPVAPERMDRVLAAILVASVACMVAVAIPRSTAARVFALIGIGLAALELKELRAGFQPKSVLYRRHVRYILASYFYVLTVVSVVHLGEELPGKWKWLWPAAIGLPVVYLSTASVRPPAGRVRGSVLRWSVLTTLAVALALGGYAAWELVRDARAPASAAATPRLPP